MEKIQGAGQCNNPEEEMVMKNKFFEKIARLLVHVPIQAMSMRATIKLAHVRLSHSSAMSKIKDVFEEVLLYDRPAPLLTNETILFGNVVYASIIQSDVSGFNGQTYDFEMILPERGFTGWTSSTAYYFYIELS